MTIGKILGVFFTFALIAGMVLYYLTPFQQITFRPVSANDNFTINNQTFAQMQFYPNMRFANNTISYEIIRCPLDKKNEMQQAFQIMQNITPLKFYPVSSNPQINITCDSHTHFSDSGLFIAGEGGPTKIIKTINFNVIQEGQILLIRKNECPRPNVAVHELLHVLGFNHSKNSNNIMYPVTNCDQTIGNDTIALINKLYSYPQYEDLNLENVSARIHSRYIDTIINVKNNGLKKSGNAEVLIYANQIFAQKIQLAPMDIGEGQEISLNNSWLPVTNVKTLDFIINSTSPQLQKNNKRIRLKV